MIGAEIITVVHFLRLRHQTLPRPGSHRLAVVAVAVVLVAAAAAIAFAVF